MSHPQFGLALDLCCLGLGEGSRTFVRSELVLTMERTKYKTVENNKKRMITNVSGIEPLSGPLSELSRAVNAVVGQCNDSSIYSDLSVCSTQEGSPTVRTYSSARTHGSYLLNSL